MAINQVKAIKERQNREVKRIYPMAKQGLADYTVSQVSYPSDIFNKEFRRKSCTEKLTERKHCGQLKVHWVKER